MRISAQQGAQGEACANEHEDHRPLTAAYRSELARGTTGCFGRAARHAKPTAGSLLATSRLSTVQLPSMAGVGATQAIRQAFLAAWKSANPDVGVPACLVSNVAVTCRSTKKLVERPLFDLTNSHCRHLCIGRNEATADFPVCPGITA